MIEWCNQNEGFLTALLTFVGIILNFSAVIIAIKTARLPYKKKLLLSRFYNYGGIMGLDEEPRMMGISVEAVNAGNRQINLNYIGLGINHKSEMHRIYNFDSMSEHKGKLNPSETISVLFESEKIAIACSRLKVRPEQKLYIYAIDSEGRKYKKRIGRVGAILNALIINDISK